MQNFKELKVWERAHLFTLSIYRLTKDFPKEELYGLTSQFVGPRHLFPQILQKDAVKIQNWILQNF